MGSRKLAETCLQHLLTPPGRLPLCLSTPMHSASPVLPRTNRQPWLCLSCRDQHTPQQTCLPATHPLPDAVQPHLALRRHYSSIVWQDMGRHSPQERVLIDTDRRGREQQQRQWRWRRGGGGSRAGGWNPTLMKRWCRPHCGVLVAGCAVLRHDIKICNHLPTGCMCRSAGKLVIGSRSP